MVKLKVEEWNIWLSKPYWTFLLMNLLENAVTLTRITIDALKGDRTAKAQLRQIWE
ncbi:hypothetical protein AAUPMG_02912 [Pasteurella multocida subsp. multocida str. Anand1_goat]|nr:hypothetical protein AAUPMG_02912 [Pasteurella multocida subsp. multocida str. Anand1_goat]